MAGWITHLNAILAIAGSSPNATTFYYFVVLAIFLQFLNFNKTLHELQFKL